MTKTRRIFVGIGFPQEILDEIGHIRKVIDGAKWLRPENLHLTIAFIGNIDEDKCRLIETSLESVKFSPFKLRLQGTDFWKQGVLWIGVKKSDVLDKLKIEVEKALIPCGYIPDVREFIPHVTIARINGKYSHDDLNNFLRHRADFKSPKFGVDHFSLYESKASDAGNNYYVIKNYDTESKKNFEIISELRTLTEKNNLGSYNELIRWKNEGLE